VAEEMQYGFVGVRGRPGNLSERIGGHMAIRRTSASCTLSVLPAVRCLLLAVEYANG
jgi:hypothetical protein